MLSRKPQHHADATVRIISFHSAFVCRPVGEKAIRLQAASGLRILCSRLRLPRSVSGSLARLLAYVHFQLLKPTKHPGPCALDPQTTGSPAWSGLLRFWLSDGHK